MINRLGLVIHWLGFLSGAALAIGFLLLVVTLGWNQGIFIAIFFSLSTISRAIACGLVSQVHSNWKQINLSLEEVIN